MSLPVGTVIEMTRDAPYKEYKVCKGDIGIINYVAKTGKYSIHIYGKSNPHKDSDRIYGKSGDCWIPFDYVKEYEYKIGDRVKILNVSCFVYGTIVSKTIGTYQVYLDDGRLAIVAPNRFRLVEEHNEWEEVTMKLSGFNKVAVIEINGNDYHYALYDDNIIAGDKVLVSGRMTEVLTVKDIITADEAREKFKGDIVAEVKCKVDLSAYEQRVKNREEAEKLRKKMDEEIKKMDELNKYEMYASSNPVLKEMLEKFKSLGV